MASEPEVFSVDSCVDHVDLPCNCMVDLATASPFYFHNWFKLDQIELIDGGIINGGWSIKVVDP